MLKYYLVVPIIKKKKYFNSLLLLLFSKNAKDILDMHFLYFDTL